jgi:hypothetical protein
VSFQRARWKRYAAIGAAIVAFIAALEGAASVVSASTTWLRERFESRKPTPEERRAEWLFGQARRDVPWIAPPIMYPRSKTFMARQPRVIDPRRVHRFSLESVLALTDPEGLVRRAAVLAGGLVAVEGLIGRGWQVSASGPVSNWIYPIHGRSAGGPFVLCRVPLPTLPESALRRGSPVRATGAVAASGYVEGAEGKPQRLAYLVCVAIAKRPARWLVEDGFNGRRRDVLTVRDDAAAGRPPRISCGDQALLTDLPRPPLC